MSSGLNCVYNCRETRNYFFLRIRATVYTVMFILVIIFLLVLSVFGNSLNIFIAEHGAISKKYGRLADPGKEYYYTDCNDYIPAVDL